MEDTSKIHRRNIVALAAPVLLRQRKQRKSRCRGISNLFPWGSNRALTDGRRQRRGDGRTGGEFMCLGRVKGTRVATSATDRRRRQLDATRRGRNGWQKEGRQGNAQRDALARVIETNSIPRIVSNARTRLGPSWDRESAVSRTRESL